MAPRRSSGVLAAPFYLWTVGAGHVWLAAQYYERTTGLARDGQAFSGTAVLGLAFLGLIAAPFALRYEHSWNAFGRGAVAGVLVGAAGVAYTAAATALHGYVTGGTAGEIRCVLEGGREICPPGDGTWIADARTEVVVLLAGIGIAYVAGNALARYAGRLRSTVA